MADTREEIIQINSGEHLAERRALLNLPYGIVSPSAVLCSFRYS